MGQSAAKTTARTIDARERTPDCGRQSATAVASADEETAAQDTYGAARCRMTTSARSRGQSRVCCSAHASTPAKMTKAATMTLLDLVEVAVIRDQRARRDTRSTSLTAIRLGTILKGPLTNVSGTLLGSETSIGSVRGITGIFPSLVPKRTLTTTFNRMLDLIRCSGAKTGAKKSDKCT